MSSVLKAMATSHRLTMAAAEEAQRAGSPAIEVEHLLIALSASSTAAGQVLRAAGATPAAVRRAVEEQHVDNLASINIQVPPPETSTSAIAGPQNVDWNEQAERLFTDASSDASGMKLLRALVAKPAGPAAAALQRLSVLSAVSAAASGPAPAVTPAATSRTAGAVTLAVHLQAGIEDVWKLLDDPVARPEWDSNVASMTEQPDGSWLAAYRTGVPGHDDRYPNRRLERRIETVSREHPSGYEWQISWPAVGVVRGAVRLRIDLQADASHATAVLTSTPVPVGGLREVWASVTRTVRRGERALTLSRTGARLARAVEIRAAGGSSTEADDGSC